MSTTSLKKAVMDGIRHTLVPLGFENSGKDTLSRCCNDVRQFVNMQKGTKSTKTALAFTINIGVYSVPLGEKLGKTGELDVWDCHWRSRIGFLAPQNDDKWWEVCNIADVDQVLMEINDILRKSVVPTLHEL